eukprot:gene1400-9970_t
MPDDFGPPSDEPHDDFCVPSGEQPEDQPPAGEPDAGSVAAAPSAAAPSPAEADDTVTVQTVSVGLFAAEGADAVPVKGVADAPGARAARSPSGAAPQLATDSASAAAAPTRRRPPTMVRHAHLSGHHCPRLPHRLSAHGHSPHPHRHSGSRSRRLHRLSAHHHLH